MRVLVMGAGAIGSLVGGRLAAAGNDVTLVGRPALVNAVNARGLVIVDSHDNSCAHSVRAVSAVEEIQQGDAEFDLIVITVKVYDTLAAATSLLPLAKRGTPVLVLQNGVGGDEIAKQVLEGSVLFSAIITLVVSVLEPGRIRLTTTKGGVGLAPASSGQPLTALADLLRQAGFSVRTYGDYRAMKWSKLLLNLLANASPAILDMPPDEIFADSRLSMLEVTAFREALSVMRGMGLSSVSLPDYPVPLFAWALSTLPLVLLRPLFQRLVAGGRGGKMPSLHIDLSRGKGKSEVEYLNGAVVRAAQQLGMRVPANEALNTVLVGIVRGDIPWEDYRGRPDALLRCANML
ncbi:MAG: ketopantoate reductase family protein [Chloroflexota bacterium]